MATKITFSLSPEIVENATGGILLGEFNNWNLDNGISLKKEKDGSLKTTVELEAGQTYQYRYLLNDGRWVNDGTAQHYSYAHGYNVDNCVIAVPAEEVKAVKEVAAPKVKKAAKAKPAVEAVATAADDLTKIEGVGAKIAELLIAESILTYKDLAKATAKKLKAILEAAGPKFNVHEPSTWPKQAKLAAAGKWDELATLQAELKGGK